MFDSRFTVRDACLLVMGAYGHSRFREFVLGGRHQKYVLASTGSVSVRDSKP